MAKLWDKGYELNAQVEAFTVGNDYILDRELLVADCAAGVAHVRMLAACRIISDDSGRLLAGELASIAARASRGEIVIDRADEDGHTTIETLLTEALGEPGKEVHAGRSRNDQVLAATRIYTRERLLDVFARLDRVVTLLLDRAEEHEYTVMPGRTHLQAAMLSTLGLWFGSYAEQLLDDWHLLASLYPLCNRSPLGSAASYGVPLPIDREMVAKTLGFASVQNNVLSVQASRGHLDGQIIGALADIFATLSRMASDLVLFSLPELGYVKLPEALCSGSSIMPQKRNPDVLELLRGKAATVAGYAEQARAVVRSLPSGYNRDVQETKAPLLGALAEADRALAVVEVLAGEMEPVAERMKSALTPELFATDYALELLASGTPFRDAYRLAAEGSTERPMPDPETARRARTATGSPGNLNLSAPRGELEERRELTARWLSEHRAAVRATVGLDSVIPVPERPSN